MKSFIIIIIVVSFFFLTFSCQNQIIQSKKLEEQKRLNDRADATYKLIDLVTPSIPFQRITHIKFFKKVGSVFENETKETLTYILERDTFYNFEEKALINNLIQNLIDTSDLDTSRLSENSRNFLDNSAKNTTQNFTFAFSKFIFNDSLTLACNYLGNYFGDEEPGSKLGGKEELIFFENRGGEWVFKSRKTMVYY